jgi:hypothetical protein
VSTTISGPVTTDSPEGTVVAEAATASRTLYVVPGLRGATSILVVAAAAVIVDAALAFWLEHPSHESGYSFHWSTYETSLRFSMGLNWTVMEVCERRGNAEAVKNEKK